ncbi:hypothetical protein Fot_22676 [Forsythia ovata]|uniref:Uncharacterized protein n=1 Tax=Forsythia ovata TaxID=205694 RepID=A0ABD1V073_9LAMI
MLSLLICVTIVSKSPLEYTTHEEANDPFLEVEDDEVDCEMQTECGNLHCEMQANDDDEADRNVNVNWDELEIAQDYSVDVLTENCNNVAFSINVLEIVRDNGEENPKTTVRSIQGMRLLVPLVKVMIEPIAFGLKRVPHNCTGNSKRPHKHGKESNQGELEHEIETETLLFNNVQSQGNDYWQDLEIPPENDVRLQANDDNEVSENVDDYWDGMDINVDDQNVESPARNSKNTASSYSSRPEAIPRIAHLFRAQKQEMRLPRMCSWNSRLTPESRDIVEVLDDPHLRIRCTLHASPDERVEEYVRLFISDPTREDPILDAYLHEDGVDGAAGDEELDDIFE